MPAKIVALDKSFSVASQIAADDIPLIAAGGFRTIVNNRPDGEEAGQLSSAEARLSTEAAGLTYRYLPVTTATLSDAEIDEFEAVLGAAEGPVLAHCRSGTRCYLLWAATQMRAGLGSADDLIRQAADRGFDISALTRFQ